MSTFLNVTFYKFTPLNNLSHYRTRLRDRCRELALKGTILISEEGFNASIAGPEDSVRKLVVELKADPDFGEFESKESLSERAPFIRMFVKIKKEIIPMGRRSSHHRGSCFVFDERISLNHGAAQDSCYPLLDD